MGIKNLYKFIEKYCPEAIQLTKITKYKNKTLGIDFNLMIHKLIYAIRKNGYDIKNNDKIITHIHALILKFKSFKKYNVKPIFVFDGMANKIKYAELEKRNKIWSELELKYTNAVTEEDKKKYYYLKSRITEKEFEECRELINIFGYNIIDSKEEADIELVILEKSGIIDYIVSDDMDILLFGAEILLKKFTTSENKKIQEINLSVIKKELGFNQNDLIKLGILLGSDYCDNKPISINKAYKIIKNMETNEIEKKCKNAIKYFNNANNKTIDKNEIIELEIDKQNIYSFLKKYDYTKEYIDELVNYF